MKEASFSKGFFIADFSFIAKTTGRLLAGLKSDFYPFKRYRSTFTFSIRNEFTGTLIMLLAFSSSFSQNIKKDHQNLNRLIISDSQNEHCGRILDAKIEGDILKLEVPFCRKSEIKGYYLITDGMYEESFPPNIFLRLGKGPDTHCEKQNKTIVSFDLSQLRYKGSKQVRIKLSGFKDAIIYKYE